MSESTRPHKRQRTCKNRFLDLEASVEDESQEEDEQDVEDEFMDDCNDDAHSVLHQSLGGAIEEEGMGKWRELLERARRLGRTSDQRPLHPEYNVEDDNYQLQDNDMLWEIGCTVGMEGSIPFKVLQRAIHLSTPEVLASSIVATAIPGRVYAEVSGYAQAIKLAQSLVELDPSRIFPVPREQIPKILNIASSRPGCQEWARVGGKKKEWNWYMDDTGLIEKIDGKGKKYLVLIPRLVLEEVRGRQSRPIQALVERAVLETHVGAALVKDDLVLEGGFTWKSQRFSADGFLLIDLDDIDILPLLEALPSSAELAVFRSTALLSRKTAIRTADMIGRTRMKAGDRVKVMVGTYLGMIGEVVEMKENEVAVYLSSQDITEDMMLDSVRAAFVIGDQVRVLDGENMGLIGWVVGIFADMLRVVNVEAQTEVNVPKNNAEFHTPAHIISLQPRDEYPKWGKLGGQNHNDIYLGKRVMVIGIHLLKGYKGFIKSTTTDGYAFLQLDTQPQQTNKIKLIDLACLTHQDSLISYLLSNRPLTAPLYTLPPSSSAATSTANALIGLTPAWDPSSHSSSPLNSAWDPSAEMPRPQDRPTRPIHWLDDPPLKNLRLKLVTTDPAVGSPCVEFKGVEDDKVKVRDKGTYKFVSFESVNALRPDSKSDLVIIKGNEFQGERYKVVEITGNSCILRKPGVRPTKKDPDRICLITDLIQVYP